MSNFPTVLTLFALQREQQQRAGRNAVLLTDSEAFSATAVGTVGVENQGPGRAASRFRQGEVHNVTVYVDDH